MRKLAVVIIFFNLVARADPSCPTEPVIDFLTQREGVSLFHNCGLEVRITTSSSDEDPSHNRHLVALRVKDLALAESGSAQPTLIEFAIPSKCFEEPRRNFKGKVVYREVVNFGSESRTQAIGLELDAFGKTTRLEASIYETKPYRVLGRSVCAAEPYSQGANL
jgi:hypothetical protein